MTEKALNKLKSEVSLFKKAQLAQNHDACFYHLGRAHILSQGSALHHLLIHFRMLAYSIRRFDTQEIFGQVLRLVVTIPGHLIGKVPRGNIGWSTIGLRAELPVPDDLKELN